LKSSKTELATVNALFSRVASYIRSVLSKLLFIIALAGLLILIGAIILILQEDKISQGGVVVIIALALCLLGPSSIVLAVSGAIVGSLLITNPSPPTATPTPPNVRVPSQTPEASLALFDDFNDGNAEGWSPSGVGNWLVENGEYVVDMGEGKYRDGVSVAGDLQWTDYTFEVDITGERGVDKHICARYIDVKNQYIVNLRGKPFNDVLLVKRENGY
jgi:hypothetical protein